MPLPVPSSADPSAVPPWMQAWFRFLARMTDLVVIVLSLVAFRFLLRLMSTVLDQDAARQLEGIGTLLGLFFLMTLWGLLESLMLFRCATTPGKALFGITVVRPDGSRLGFGQAFQRFILVLTAGLSFACFPWALISLLSSYRGVVRQGGAFWDGQGTLLRFRCGSSGAPDRDSTP